MFDFHSGSSGRSGQTMILTVLVLGSTMLGATTIGGLLFLYQVRQTTNFFDSARALSAADAGLEFGLYRFFKDSTYPEPASLSNGTRFVETIIASTTLKSIGYAQTARRAFQYSLPTATSTFP